MTDRLRDEPDGPLTTALRTPLMVFLARETYRRPDTDPADLLRPTDFLAVERAPLHGYIPAVYRDRGPARASARPGTRRTTPGDGSGISRPP